MQEGTETLERPEDVAGQALPERVLGDQGRLQIKAYQVGAHALEIRKAVRERQMMERSPNRYAYRCLPLVMGSQMGYEILNDGDFTASWNGNDAQEALQIRRYGRGSPTASSHFGMGVLTINPGWLFRTPPGIGLMCLGPANYAKHGIAPLEGFIETDWSDFTFTMNWQFTAPGEVFFRRGEPIARILPYPQFFLDQFAGELHPKAAMEPRTQEEYAAWDAARSDFIKRLDAKEPEAVKMGWMRHYMRGVRFKSGEGSTTHQTRLAHGPFVDLRNGKTVE